MILTSTGDLHSIDRNHLLYEFRLNYQSDKWATTVEWLFQLGRHWNLWQDEEMGSFPISRRDLFGPVDRATSEATGEDSDYYTIDDILRSLLEQRGAKTWTDSEDGWSHMAHPADERYIQDLIVHTVKVLERLYNLLNAAGMSH